MYSTMSLFPAVGSPVETFTYNAVLASSWVTDMPEFVLMGMFTVPLAVRVRNVASDATAEPAPEKISSKVTFVA